MKLNSKLAGHYYTAAEARKVLGIDESTFQYWGKDERITRTYLPGRKQPVYPKKEIDNLAHGIEATIIMDNARGTEFRKATLDDIEEETQLAVTVFGKASSMVPRRSFLEKNPSIDYHLYDQGKLVSYITVLPLKTETITKFMQGQIRGWQIDPNDIEQYTPGKPIECLIMDMVTTPFVPPVKRSEYGRSIIVNILRELRELGEQGIEITKLHAIGGTPSGQRILKSAKFTEGEKVGTGRISFELDLMNADTRLLRDYREALEHWKQHHQNTLVNTSTRRKKQETS